MDAIIGRTHLSVWTSRLLQKHFPHALWAGQPATSQVALTFDDGPDPQDTLQLLAVLARQQITATFFHLGEQIERWPEGVRAVAAAGHQLAIHGYRHRPFPLEAPAALRGQLAHTQQLLAALSARDPATVRDVRPPYGLYTPATLASLTAWGYRAVMWSLVPFHWLQPAQPTIDQTMRMIRSGSVLVLHERLGGPPVAQLTDVLVTRLKAAGYHFVSIEQMWRSHLATQTGSIERSPVRGLEEGQQ